MTSVYLKCKKEFVSRYKTDQFIAVKSPGRINIIGDHTDYNEGYVFPAAVNYNMYILIAPRKDNKCVVYSLNTDQELSFDIADSLYDSSGWIAYFIGAVKLSKINFGLNIVFGGDIPIGAGMSSSAAISCGTLLAIYHLLKKPIDRKLIASQAQRIEQEFLDVNCGLMDQLACLMGKTNHAILIDCETNTINYKEIDFSGYRMGLINSNVNHNLKDSAYNTRRDESIQALNILRKEYGNEKKYKNFKIRYLEKIVHKMPEVLFKRAYHVISENDRVLMANQCLDSNDMETFGNLLTLSHQSLKYNYDVTCAETDFIVEQLLQYDEVLGARQMGGGFGGCVLYLIKDRDCIKIADEVKACYKSKFKKNAETIPVKITKGAYLL